MQNRGNGRGTPFEFDLARVEELAAEGYSQSMLAGEFGCSARTIRNRLAKEDDEFALAHARGLARFQGEILAAVMAVIRDSAHPDHGKVLMLAAKTQLGWVEPARPVKIEGTIEHRRSADDLMRMAADPDNDGRSVPDRLH